MKRTLRAALAVAVSFALALVVPTNEVSAAPRKTLDVAELLNQGGVRLLVVDFYASWCKPCEKELPQWKRIQEEYRNQGVRIVLVRTEDPNGATKPLPFEPDEIVNDKDGAIAELFLGERGGASLPATFVWSWQKNLLASARGEGAAKKVERAIEAYLASAPRVEVKADAGAGTAVERALSTELTNSGKLLVVSGAQMRKAFEEAKRAQERDGRYDESAVCETGKELPPNSILEVTKSSEGRETFLSLQAHDIAKGCLIRGVQVPWRGDVNQLAREAVDKLVAAFKREGPPQMAGGSGAAKEETAAPDPGPTPGPVKREDKIENPTVKVRPVTSNDPVLVSFASQPSGARVEMDGATLCASTPCKKMVDPGLRTFRMSAEKFVTKEERVRVEGDEQKVTWKLESNLALVTVDTGAVSGLPITVDGEAAGTSPLRVELAAGPHRIEIKDACYEPARADIGVERGVSKRVELNGVQKTAGLRVELSDAKDEPVQGDVKLDGVVVGRTWKTLTVPVCAREVSVQSGGESWSQAVSLRAQETTKVAAKLRPACAAGSSWTGTQCQCNSDTPEWSASAGRCVAATSKAPGGMAVIPAGTVTLEDGIGTKRVASFSIDVTEVTVDAYAACVRAGNCSKPNDAGLCNWGKGDRGNHPVNCVDWNQAKAFCGWAGKRLPSEEEWQLAAESAEGRKYPWGSRDPSNQLCWDGEGSPAGKGKRQSTCAVGSFPSGDSAQGVKDLSGNVSEWTDSCCGSDCSARVIRGGGWLYTNPALVRAADRGGYDPSGRINFLLGFRCARSN